MSFTTQTHTHFQTGLTVLKMAQSEGGCQDVCDILLQYTQQGGSKVISPEQEVKRGESEKEGEGGTNRQQQETATQLTEVRGTNLVYSDLSTCACKDNESLQYSCCYKQVVYIHCRVEAM